jgi:2-methylcitrate dehydratase PrpD
MDSGDRLTRRHLFERVSWVLAAAAAMPARTMRAEEWLSPEAPGADASVMATLTDYMSAAAGRDLPAAVVEKAKHHVLDTLAAMVSGVELPPGQVALKFARAHDTEKTATVVGTNILCGAAEAALVNGMLAHSDETDDSHAPSHCHPGCGIVPSALAAGEHFGISGTHFLRAVALGYDVGPRVTLALGGFPFQMETHRSSHNIANNFGAGAAAGCAAGFTSQQMRWVLSYAGQQASGVAAWQRDTQHVEKALVFGGTPARNGVTSALLIALGATGVDDIMSGDDNFLIANSAKSNAALLIEKLGERYEVTRTNVKKWTVGSPIQAPLDAIEIIRKKHPFEADQVQKVVVRVATSEAKTVNNREMPDISMQHMVAVMLLDKTASFAAAHDKPRMKDAALLRQKAKVQLVPDEELERLYPQRVGVVEMTFADGTRLTERVEAVRGTTGNPMPKDEIIAKATDLMAPFLGAAKCRQLIDAIFDLEHLKEIRGLRPLLQRS